MYFHFFLYFPYFTKMHNVYSNTKSVNPSVHVSVLLILFAQLADFHETWYDHVTADQHNLCTFYISYHQKHQHGSRTNL
jgi:hypothetical protein